YLSGRCNVMVANRSAASKRATASMAVDPAATTPSPATTPTPGSVTSAPKTMRPQHSARSRDTLSSTLRSAAASAISAGGWAHTAAPTAAAARARGPASAGTVSRLRPAISAAIEPSRVTATVRPVRRPATVDAAAVPSPVDTRESRAERPAPTRVRRAGEEYSVSSATRSTFPGCIVWARATEERMARSMNRVVIPCLVPTEMHVLQAAEMDDRQRLVDFDRVPGYDLACLQRPGDGGA